MTDQRPIFTSATPLPASLNPQIVYSWKAPLRAYKKTSKRVIRFYLALALLLSVIVWFFGDLILIVPIWSVLFLFYTLTITPPPEVDNKITKFGIETAGITLRWEALDHFYFKQRFGFTILTIVSHGPYYFHAYLIVPSPEVKKSVMKILTEHIIYQDRPRQTFTDRMIGWLSYLLPEDDEQDVPMTVHVGGKHKDHGENKEDLIHVKDTLASFFQRSENPSPSPHTTDPTV
ncbi:MAG: hypothetical protein ACEQSA_00645 [Weeksellaceae bacterium]